MKKPTIPKLKGKLQLKFNKFIRERDGDDNGMGLCISCGTWQKLQAGHYFAVSGYDGLRFDEDNVHGECSRCNCWDESHLIPYGRNLLEKIGQERYNALLERADDYKKNGNRWQRADLEEMMNRY